LGFGGQTKRFPLSRLFVHGLVVLAANPHELRFQLLFELVLDNIRCQLMSKDRPPQSFFDELVQLIELTHEGASVGRENQTVFQRESSLFLWFLGVTAAGNNFTVG